MVARVVWDRMDDIQSAKKLIPFKQAASRENFKPPARIETDFQRLLKHDVPHVNWTFELIHDWYYTINVTAESLAAYTEAELREMYENGTRILREVQEKDGEQTIIYYALDADGSYAVTEDYKPEYIRGQQTAIDWKSKIGNSDMSTNFKTDYTHRVEKGDYVVREDGVLFMLNWNVTLHANNQATQSVECNGIVDITRDFPPLVDEKGYVLQKGGRRPVAAGLPISHSEYAGRPDYSGASLQAGMHPDHLISVYCQWNKTTRRIRLDDEFVLGDFTYRIMNISLAEIQVDKDHGILVLNAKRVAGGSVNGDE